MEIIRTYILNAAAENPRQKGGDDRVGFWGEQPIWLPTLLPFSARARLFRVGGALRAASMQH
jgi:hypothetical protein